jgi:hypothetical protein
MKRVALHFKQASKGQSFVELAIVGLVLLGLLVGMVEFGYLLNQYIGVVDGAREGARFGSTSDPFSPPPTGSPCPTFEDCIDQVIEGTGGIDHGALSPIVLDPTTDDVVISYFTVIQGPPISLIRWPQNTCGCWSKYHNHDSLVSTLQIRSAINSNAPSTGVLVVEVFYDYHQLLHMPGLANFVPDPIPVNTYSIMPLSAAEPTATLCPTLSSSGTC